MADKTTDEILAEVKLSDRSAYLEQRIYVLSPAGTFVTTLVLFALLAASYVLTALATGVPIFLTGSLVLDPRARTALVLAVLMSAILGVQRHALLRQRADLFKEAEQFKGGLAVVAHSSALTPPGARLGIASLLGLLLGIATTWSVFDADPTVTNHPAILLWFGALISLLTMAFARGVELTWHGSKSRARLVLDDLIIDLLRIDRLSFLGRTSARFSLIWFAIGAASSLFFLSSGITKFTVGLLAVFFLIGAATFFGLMEGIHRRILIAKDAELERLRCAIDAVRDKALTDGEAAQRLQGLIAYEARIAAAPEWPFDQPTAMRLGASALILTLPWFGQAIAAYLIEHLGSR